MVVLLLSGKKGAGKDTFAQELIAVDPSYVRVAFADALKDEVSDVYSIDRSLLDDVQEKHKYRQHMQDHGLKQRKQDVEYWTKKANETILKHISQGRNVVVTDVRFENELWITGVPSKDHFSIRIERPALESDNDEHPSEIALDHYRKFDMFCFVDEGIVNVREYVKSYLQTVESL